MVITSFISSILVLALGIWAYLRLESSMNLFAERQLLIEPDKFSYKMWKDMPVSMYQSFTFFNLTNWSQVKSVGQKPRFVEVGPYVYKTVWAKTDVNFLDDEKLVSFAEKKHWHFQAHLSKGYEDDLIWTINTPLMTALALIQNAPVITRNIVSVILDGLGEGAFIKRPIRSLLFEGYSDLIVSVGPLFDRRFANFNGKFAYLYNKNDTVDGTWTVQTGLEDLGQLNKITRYQSAIVNMTSFSSGQMPQGLNEVKAECAPAWSLDQSTNGQLFAPFNRDSEQQKLQRQLQQVRARSMSKQQEVERQQQANSLPQAAAVMSSAANRAGESIVQAPKRFFSRISSSVSSASSVNNNNNNNNNNHHATANNQASGQQQQQQQQYQAANTPYDSSTGGHQQSNQQNNIQDRLQQLKDFGKFIFYPDLCRPIHLLPSKQTVTSDNGIEAARYFIDPRVFMNSSQFPSNKCYEMNPRPPLANALAATINSVTGANVNVPGLVAAAGSSPFALFIPPNNHHAHHNYHQQHQHENGAGLFERANHHPNSFLNNALHSLSQSANQAADQLASAATNNSPIGRLSRVRQLFSNIVSQRMSANPLLPSLSAGPASLLMPNHHNNHNHNHNNNHFSNARQAAGEQFAAAPSTLVGNGGAFNPLSRQELALDAQSNPSSVQAAPSQQLGTSPQEPPGVLLQQPAMATAGLGPPLISQMPAPPPPPPPPQLLPAGGSDRWVTQFRFKWPRGVFSIGQCQLGAPIYVSLPHFLDADEYYLEQVDGLKPNRSLHEFYIDVESTLHSIPVGAKARLQLNIATPELRFRNIPNAMIPVLWQEVTFRIDKPIATMLYWSFTMSASIYRLVAILLILAGSALMVFAFFGGYKRHGRGRRCGACPMSSSSAASSTLDAASRPASLAGTSQICGHEPGCDRGSCTSGSHRSDSSLASDIVASESSARPARVRRSFIKSARSRLYPTPLGTLEGRRSSWQHISCCDGASRRAAARLPAQQQQQPHCNQSSVADLKEPGHRHHHHHHHHDHEHKLAPSGGALNHAFASSCNEIHLKQNNNSRNNNNNGSNNNGNNIMTATVRIKGRRHGSEGSSEPVSSSESMANKRQNSSSLSSPKQPAWSRASSHCELMSSFGHTATLTSASNGTAESGDGVACTRCLFSCLRRSPDGQRQQAAPSVLVSAGIHASPSNGDHNCETSDIGSQVRQQQQNRRQQQLASDIDRATLSSTRSSNLDSYSSIYTTRKGRKLK